MSKQERAARTRNALVHSAAELFERHSYVKASLDEISAGAGVSRGALHFHFPNKAAVADAVETAAARALHRAAGDAGSVHVNALQALVDLSHALAQLLHSEVVVRAGFRLSCDAELRTDVSLRRQWQRCVQRLVAQAARENALAAGVAQERLVAIVMATTTGLEVLNRDDRNWLSHYTLTGFWQLLLPTVAAQRALGDLDPSGTGSSYDAVPETAQPFAPSRNARPH
ncbi:ScbR family autoregulator-binding transcription factor [Streptomyces sp. NBC_00237]|uniref:ScbR family autoregulator-binding transcription factor n=1 Tax=Streptomyces sp. NBC_00237 TaxID=2975687 RepID=UPI0022561729|nr:ScbR family autoregulator-binding transcription factor [Streptomyces sp. NBC_00237]MCX5203253.1 ScbR family autoregulator-binding transcription factor [Streptomyces sp. NBC_00237]